MNHPKVFIFDTNVYLELYRLSTNASNDILDLLDKIQNDICVPRQVYKEYLSRGEEVRKNQYNTYKNAYREMMGDLNKYITSQKSLLKNYNRLQYPMLDKLEEDYMELTNQLKIAISNYFENISLEIKDKKGYLNSDKIKIFMDKLNELGRVWNGFNSIEILDIIKEGELRFKYKIPPGYLDAEKDGINKFGDLIIWKEILQYAIKSSNNIIFVTNDVKEDWWEDNKDLRARHELYEEFNCSNSQNKIIFLTLQSFFELTTYYYKVNAYMTAIELEFNENMQELVSEEDDIKIQELINAYIDKYYEELQDNDVIEERRHIFRIHRLYNGRFQKKDTQTIYYSMETQYHAVCHESYTEIKEIGINAERHFEIGIDIEIQFNINIQKQRLVKKSNTFTLSDIKVKYKSPGEVYEDMKLEALADQMDALEEYYRH